MYSGTSSQAELEQLDIWKAQVFRDTRSLFILKSFKLFLGFLCVGFCEVQSDHLGWRDDVKIFHFIFVNIASVCQQHFLF